MFTVLDNSDDRLRFSFKFNSVESGNNEEFLFEGVIKLDDNDELSVPISLILH